MGRKSTVIELTSADREYLELQTRARTIQAQTVNRARILLLKADGHSIDDIADKVGMNRKSVMLCLSKFKKGGIENALFDAPGRGRNAEITDEHWLEQIALKEAMRQLSSREQNILRMRFFEGRTQMEVADEIHISQAQVSRLEKSALAHMRKQI